MPAEYAADALERLERELSALALDLNQTDMLELTLAGRWPQLWRPELEQYVAKTVQAAWYAKPVELSRVQFTPPLVGIGESGVLDEFLSRCDAAIGGGGEDEQGAGQDRSQHGVSGGAWGVAAATAAGGHA